MSKEVYEGIIRGLNEALEIINDDSKVLGKHFIRYRLNGETNYNLVCGGYSKDSIEVWLKHNQRILSSSDYVEVLNVIKTRSGGKE